MSLASPPPRTYSGTGMVARNIGAKVFRTIRQAEEEGQEEKRRQKEEEEVIFTARVDKG